MEDADVEAAPRLTTTNYDGVMAEHHTAEILAAFRADVSPDAFREQMTWKRFWVVEGGGEIVAVGALADFGEPGAPNHVVSQFYVRADRHRRGIGRLLLAHLTGIARADAAERLHVPSSRNAVPFYEDAGFTVDDAQPDAAVEMTWMTLPLAESPPAPG